MENRNIMDILVEGMLASERAAMDKAIATNTSVVVWRDGKVVEILPEELKLLRKSSEKLQ